MRIAFAICFMFLAHLLTYAQGPINGFMPQKGQWDIATTYSKEPYDVFFGADGEPEARSIMQQSFNLYLEHGLDSKTSLVITAPYISHDENNKGLQDASVWLKYRNERNEKDHGAFNFITAFGLTLPLSKYPIDNIAAIGRRASTIHGRLLWQYDAAYGWFFQVQSGLDFQFAPDAVAAIPFLIKGGIGTKYVYADLWFEHFRSLNANSVNDVQIAGSNSTWNKIGTTIYFPLKPWIGIFAGGAYVLSGENIGQGKRVNIGVVFRLNAGKR